ncbi:MAG: N-acetyl-gamma-glutamyl-phosphate reductase [Bacteroidetes bacterium]|nr:N-acetyl-gamma-glutamyl-phosphate reductase [Bacteroidota bacterium]
MSNTHTVRVAIIGATGYTGSELVRILLRHPRVEIAAITSERRAGEKFADVHPHFHGILPHRLESVENLAAYELDVVFLALPHGVSMDFVKKFHDERFRIIDLSGDFRLRSPAVYAEWYGKDHSYSDGFRQAVYGLPEMHRAQIADARLIANPGCYPTCSILGVLPLLEGGMIDPAHIIVDAKSGTTGAGITPKPATHYSAVSDNFRAYGLTSHRHTIEIEEQLMAGGARAHAVQFTPHLLPVDRGILATIYSYPSSKATEERIHAVYAQRYDAEPFVRVRSEPPTLKDVRGSNFCDVHITFDRRTRRIITLSAIDNLVKGAAGQAVQNMNIMFGLSEETGLDQIPMNP